MSEEELRTRLHRELVAVRDGLNELGTLDQLDDARFAAAEESFDAIVAQLSEITAMVGSLRDHPGLSVEGALVAGAVDTAVTVIRCTLGSIQAGFEDERDRRAA